MHAIVVGYWACTDLLAVQTFLNWSANCRNLCVTLIVDRLHYYVSYYIQAYTTLYNASNVFFVIFKIFPAQHVNLGSNVPTIVTTA